MWQGILWNIEKEENAPKSHISKLKEAVQRLKELRKQLREVKGKKAQNRLKKEIDELVSRKGGIKGHIKEIEQKWPGAIAEEIGTIHL